MNISSILLVQCICNDSVAIFEQIILEAGVDVDVRNAQNATPLHVALNRGANLCVGLLLSAGANCNLQVNCCLYYLYNRFFLKILNRLGLSNQSFCLDFENLFFSLLANICLKYHWGKLHQMDFSLSREFYLFILEYWNLDSKSTVTYHSSCSSLGFFEELSTQVMHCDNEGT